MAVFRGHPAAPAGKTHVPQVELQVAGVLGHEKFHTPHAVPHTDLQLFFPLHQRVGGEEGDLLRAQEGMRRFVHQAERGRGGAFAGPDRPGYGVLLSGHQRKIEEWRLAQAQERTARLRPDLLK